MDGSLLIRPYFRAMLKENPTSLKAMRGKDFSEVDDRNLLALFSTEVLMTSTFGKVHTGEDVCGAIEEAARYGYEGSISFKDGRRSVQGDVCLNGQFHPGKDFAVEVNGQFVGLNYDEVESVALGGQFGPPPEPQFSADGKPFYNGYCWQESGDVCQEFGYCGHSGCVDPMADQESRKKHGLPPGYYCGARIKTMTCPGCGHIVDLT